MNMQEGIEALSKICETVEKFQKEHGSTRSERKALRIVKGILDEYKAQNKKEINERIQAALKTLEEYNKGLLKKRRTEARKHGSMEG